MFFKEAPEMRVRINLLDLSPDRLWLLYCALIALLAAASLPAILWWLARRQAALLDGLFLLEIALLAASLAALRLGDAARWPITILGTAPEPRRSRNGA